MDRNLLERRRKEAIPPEQRIQKRYHIDGIKPDLVLDDAAYRKSGRQRKGEK